MSDTKSLPSNATSRANDSTLADDSTFARELSSFLAELTTTTNMSSLEGSLARLKLAMIEEVQKNKQEEEEDSDASSSMASPGRASTAQDMSVTSASSGSPLSVGDSSSDPPTDSSLSCSPVSQPTFPGVGGGDVGHGSLPSRMSRRVMFSIQSGARFDLKEDQLQDVFSLHGELVNHELYPRPRTGFDGYLEFSSVSAAERLVNSVLTVGDCQLHCSAPWDRLTSQPAPHQILLESRYLPRVWERDMILRSFFTKYGTVTGVAMIGTTPGNLVRYVISFKDPNPALDLIGSSVTILSSTVWVREVTRETILPNSHVAARGRGRATNLPWRR